MFQGAPLLALNATTLEIALLVFFFAVYLIKQAISTAVKEVPRQPQRPPARPAGNTPRPARPRPQNDPNLNKEIEEFLNRTAQRRGAKAQRGSGREAKPASRASEPLPTLEAVRPRPTGDSISEHVKQHLGTEEFNVRAAHLTDDITRAEQELQQHVQKAFSHQVGRLADTSRQSAKPKQEAEPGKAASVERPLDMAALLADGSRLRQAIIFSEIIERPEHRW